MRKVRKKGKSFNYRALSTEFEVGIAPFEFTKIYVLVVFLGCTSDKFNQNGPKMTISCCF